MAVHNATINRLFLQTLNWTVSKTREYGRERPYSSLRESVYSALTRWLQVAGASAGVETVAGDLLPHLIGDAKAEVDTIKVGSGWNGLAEIQNYLLIYGFLGPTGHDPYGFQSTGNGSHHQIFYSLEILRCVPRTQVGQ